MPGQADRAGAAVGGGVPGRGGAGGGGAGHHRRQRSLVPSLEWAASRCKWRWCGSSWKIIIVSLARFFCSIFRRNATGEWRRRVVLARRGACVGRGASGEEEDGLVWR